MEKNTDSIEVDIDKLPAFVQNIHIDGLKNTDPDFVKNHFTDLHSVTTFLDLLNTSTNIKQRLLELGIFKDVGVVIDTAKGPGDGYERSLYDVVFLTKEKNYFNCSASSMCDMNNNINLVLSGSVPNMFGKAECLEADFHYGLKGHDKRFVSFSKPLPTNTRIKVALGGYDEHTERMVSKFNEKSNGVYSQVRFPWMNGMNQVRLEGIWRAVSTSNLTTPLSIREHSGHSIKSALSHSYEIDTRDGVIFPSDGNYLRVRHEFSGFGLHKSEGDAFHIAQELLLKKAIPLLYGITLEGCVSTGLVHTLHADRRLNIADKYFVGGPLDMRGFRMGSLGPSTDDSCPTGASSFFLSALHIYSPLPYLSREGFSGLFRLHGFVQAGNATDKELFSSQESLFERLTNTTRVSVGAGIAFQFAGVARLELNYCFPFRALASDSIDPGFQFGLGVTYT